jgi:uncharacterized surface anchored protein
VPARSAFASSNCVARWRIALILLLGVLAPLAPTGAVAQDAPAGETAVPDGTPEATSPAPTEAPAEPTSIPAPTDTATPAPPAPTATPSPSPTPTQTAAPTATRQATAPIVVAATYSVTILPKDPNGVALLGVCFELHHDGGNKTIGARMRTICDWNFEGKLVTALAPGDYVLLETTHPDTVGRALPKFFTVTGTRSLTVNHQWLIDIVVTAKDDVTGGAARSGCYSARLVDVSNWVSACDADDGTADGITAIHGIDRGTWQIETFPVAPEGYLPMVPKQVTVTSLSGPFAVAVLHTNGGTLNVAVTNQAGDPLLDACFQLAEDAGSGTPGGQVDYRCDNADGASDGTVTFTAIPAGNYVLRQQGAAPGYLPAADQAVSITSGQTTNTTIVNRPGGVVVIHARDDLGNPINDICVATYQDAGGGALGTFMGLPCVQGDSATDGESRIIGFPTGNYVLIQLTSQSGYVRAAPKRISVTEGTTTTITIVNPLGGALTVHHQDNTGTAVVDGCFRVVKDAGGGTRGEAVGDSVCDAYDSARDGDTHITGLPSGSYLLVDLSFSPTRSNSADIPFTIATRQTKELTVTSVNHGTLRLARTDAGGATVLGGCVDVFWAAGTPNAGQQVIFNACDGLRDVADGTLELRLPNGRFEVRDGNLPLGYVQGDPITVEIIDSGLTEATIVTKRMPDLTVRAVDTWGDPVKDVCVLLFPDETSGNTDMEQAVCDSADGATDGRILFRTLVGPGVWLVRSTPDSSYPFAATSITLAADEVRTLDVVVTMPAPKILVGPLLMDITDTSATVYFTTDQKTVSTVAFGTGDPFDQSAPATAETPRKTHRIQITGLQPNTIYDWSLTTGNGYGSASADGWRFRTGASNAQIVIKKVDSAGSTLKGACFELYTDAGNGALGTYIMFECDAFEADGSNGLITFGGLDPGSYVVTEMSAPSTFKLAAPVRATLTAGQIKQVTVTDYRGGTVVKIRNEAYGHELLPGSCFYVYKRGSGESLGAYVTWSCDEFDGTDASTTVSGLPVGNYVLVQSYVPDGFVEAEYMSFSITSSTGSSLSLTVVNHQTNGEQVVAVRTVNAAGTLIPGACFSFYFSAGGTVLGSWLGNQCDGSDGRNDGITHIVLDGVEGRLVALEYLAPRGYVAGKKVAFTKERGTFKNVRLEQVAGGVSVKVTTYKGATTSKLPNACYGLYRAVGTTWEFMTVACDGWDGAADGVVRIVGVAAGTYRLYQTTTPAGYKMPAYVSVTVGTTTKSVVVRTYPAP